MFLRLLFFLPLDLDLESCLGSKHWLADTGSKPIFSREKVVQNVQKLQQKGTLFRMQGVDKIQKCYCCQSDFRAQYRNQMYTRTPTHTGYLCAVLVIMFDDLIRITG